MPGRIFRALLRIAGLVLGRIIPKKKNLIVLEGSSRYRYNENSRYLFEYLSRKPELEVYWITDDPRIRDHVLSLGCKPLYTFLDKVRVLSRAGLVISSGSLYVDQYNLVGPATKKMCLMHGIGPKASVYDGFSPAATIGELIKIGRFDYISVTSEYTASMVGKLAYKLPYNKIKVLGYPRNDQLFDRAAVEKARKEKPWCRSVFGQLPAEAKVLLYTPTWRKDHSLRLPLFDLPGFDQSEFGTFLEKNKLYLIYTVHPNAKMSGPFTSKNVYFLDYDHQPLIDLNEVMPEVDLLLNDYSTTSTDFAILDRPQVFVMPDYDDYIRQDCLIGDYRAGLPGVEAKSGAELRHLILSELQEPGRRGSARRDLLAKYYDRTLTNSCERHYNFIKNEVRK